MKPGDGAMLQLGSDVYPYTIRRISENGKSIWATRDCIKSKGASPALGPMAAPSNPTYLYVPDDNAREEKFTLRKNGRFEPVGERNSGFLCVGHGRGFSWDRSF